jgi:hypothetical protein
MKAPTFRGKPSDVHVIWRQSGDGEKRFAQDDLRRWSAANNVDYETSKRVDHERGSTPRLQHRLVFAWGQGSNESFEVGDEEWDIETGKTPKTFIEIDSKGQARIKSWEGEQVLEVAELWYDGSALVFRTPESEEARRLEAEKLQSEGA